MVVKMITAFVGTVDDESNTPISGNGKTCCMTGVSLLDSLAGREVWSNYWTDFSSEVCGFQKMIEMIGTKPHPNLTLCISEMQLVLNSIGSTQQQVLFIDMFASQLRKLEVDIYYDTQRFNNIHKRLRIHTDVIFVPMKFHMDNQQCNFNRCKKPHKIFLFSYKPPKRKWRAIFDATKVGQHYRTEEIILDKLVIPTKKQVQEIL
jgi:hypothetical protein